MAKTLAIQYGWLFSAFNKEPWLVFDIYYKKAFYTYQPSNKSDPSVLIAKTLQEVKANLPPLETGGVTPYVAPPVDPYDNNLTLVY